MGEEKIPPKYWYQFADLFTRQDELMEAILKVETQQLELLSKLVPVPPAELKIGMTGLTREEIKSGETKEAWFNGKLFEVKALEDIDEYTEVIVVVEPNMVREKRTARVKKDLMSELRLITVFVVNKLNQTVTIQIKANRVKSAVDAVSVGSSFTVSANSSDFRSLSVETAGWAPWIYTEVSCSTAPSSGSVTIYRVKNKGIEDKLVDALAITDTATHTSTTDPNKILIQEW